MMNKKIKLLIGLIVLVLIFSGSAIFLFFSPRQSGNGDILFTIERGSTVREIADGLNREGVIINEYPFLVYLFLSGESRNLQAGTYNLSTENSIHEIVEKITNGEVASKNVTIIEGWSLVEIAEFLDAEDVVERDNFIQLTGISKPQSDLTGINQVDRSFDKDYRVLKDLPEGASLEGYLFPDTHRISTENEEEIVEIMIRNMERRMKENQIFEQLEEGQDFHDIVTMASLIEKEVATEEDMKMVSDILWRRLRAGMPLQIDATVNYITGRRDIDVTIMETQIDSTYNTYKYTGLPDGPIANPSVKSIEAALNPKANDFWYYLSDPETGDTIFSRNHLEHVEAKNKYLR